MANLEPRQKIQLSIAVLLVVASIGTVSSYIILKGFDDDLVKQIVRDYHILVVAGIAASFAIFGLGRTVQPDKPS